jgi:hypothetical protein
MMYRYLKGRLKRAIGNRTIAFVARHAGVPRHAIDSVLHSEGQYAHIERIYLERLATTLGVTYVWLARGLVGDEIARPMTLPEHQAERSRLLAALARREQRRAQVPVGPVAAAIVGWANARKLEVKWTPDGKCQILHDHEYVLAEADSLPGALELAHREGV